LAQELGLSLREIEGLKGRLDAGAAFCSTLRDTVRARLDRVASEIAALERLRAELQGFLERCTARDPALPCPIVAELTSLERAVGEGAVS
jgi:DNA-binding transcriptional MerR regulator